MFKGFPKKNENNCFEVIYAKGVANCIALYMISIVPLIVLCTIATKNLIELNILKKYFR